MNRPIEFLGRRPCPRCGRLMTEYLELCWDCQFQEAERARRQETFDQLMMDAELEAREADRLDLADTQDCVIYSMRGW